MSKDSRNDLATAAKILAGAKAVIDIDTIKKNSQRQLEEATALRKSQEATQKLHEKMAKTQRDYQSEQLEIAQRESEARIEVELLQAKEIRFRKSQLILEQAEPYNLSEFASKILIDFFNRDQTISVKKAAERIVSIAKEETLECLLFGTSEEDAHHLCIQFLYAKEISAYGLGVFSSAEIIENALLECMGDFNLKLSEKVDSIIKNRIEIIKEENAKEEKKRDEKTRRIANAKKVLVLAMGLTIDSGDISLEEEITELEEDINAYTKWGYLIFIFLVVSLIDFIRNGHFSGFTYLCGLFCAAWFAVCVIWRRATLEGKRKRLSQLGQDKKSKIQKKVSDFEKLDFEQQINEIRPGACASKVTLMCEIHSEGWGDKVTSEQAQYLIDVLRGRYEDSW